VSNEEFPLSHDAKWIPPRWMVMDFSIILFYFILFIFSLHYNKSYRLGLVLGSKLYYDFSEDTDWEPKIAELVKGL
jgi:hypothetical protein